MSLSPPLRTVFHRLLLYILLQLAAISAHAADAAPAPDYKARINAIFDKSASCRITGYYLDDHGGHDLDFTTPNAEAFQLLKQYFLHENPRFLGVGKSARLGEGYIHHFYFTWLNSRGKTVAKASLEETDYLLLQDTDELFCTTPLDFPHHGNNATLQGCVVYLVLSKYKNAPRNPATPAKPPAARGTAKSK